MSNFDDYQEFTNRTAIYPSTDWREYLMNGLVSEIGELAALYKREVRDDVPVPKKEVEKEFGDILWYLTRLVDEEGSSLDVVASGNIAKLQDRMERNVLQGSGGDR